ncbi:MAG: right-handed parallel beta-helix repeat-containing protein, partial [Planctomycetota bacterium]
MEGGWRFVGGAILCTASSPTVKNCVIRDNTSEYGAGISCHESSPTITNCTITDNSVLRAGGAVFCRPECSPTIVSCTINDNSAVLGGGIYCTESELAITNCTMSGNTAESDGGAITFYRGSVTIENCVISSNTAETYGGGMYCWDSNETIVESEITGNSARVGGGIYRGGLSRPTDTIIIDCVISANSSSSRGGGIHCESGRPTIINSTISGNTASSGGGMWCEGGGGITNCVISGNSARGSGGGFYFTFSRPKIANSAIIGNKAGWWGAGIFFDVAEATITNCTISENSAMKAGGGIWADGVYGTMTNTIIWNNLPEQITTEYWNVLATYNDVQDGWPGDGNIDSDPWFVEAGYWDANGTPGDANDDFWVEGDYRLLEGSPCIDSGDPNYAAGPNETDLDGKARVIDGDEDGTAVVDMGAYEYIAPLEVEMTLVP